MDETHSPRPSVGALRQAYITLGQRRLFLECAGVGHPTVVLEAGAGQTRATWDPIWAPLTTFTHACRYDRASLGQSDAAPTPRTVLDLVQDLHALLTQGGVAGPYVLVGHSLGGLIVQVYAHRYPAEVVGLILIDSSHPDQAQREGALYPPPTPLDNEILRAMRDATVQPDPAQHVEGIDLATSFVQARVVTTLHDLPVIVLTRNRPSDWPTELPSGLIAGLEQVWREMQFDLTRLSARTTHLIAERSSHFIHHDQSVLVLSTIRQLVTATR